MITLAAKHSLELGTWSCLWVKRSCFEALSYNVSLKVQANSLSDISLSIMYLSRGFNDEDTHLELQLNERAQNITIIICDDNGCHPFLEVRSYVHIVIPTTVIWKQHSFILTEKW